MRLWLFFLLLLSGLAQAQDLWPQLLGPRPTSVKAGPSTDPDAQRGVAWVAGLEGNTAGQVAGWCRFVQQNPRHPAALAAWTLLAGRDWATAFPAVLEPVARAVLADGGAPVPLVASARLALAVVAREAGQSGAPPSGTVRAWKMVGPFDNVSRSGFAKAFPPQSELDFAKPVKGKDDRALSWADLPGTDSDGRCMVAGSLSHGQGEVYYCATAVSGATGPATLRLDPSGACQVWLNGDCVFRRSTYGSSRPLLAEPYAVNVTLASGWNTLLVKLASDVDSSEADLVARFTTVDADTDLTLQVDPSQARSAACKPATREDLPLALTSIPSTLPDAPVLRAEVLSAAGAHGPALQGLKEAVQAHPDSAWLLWVVSELLAGDDQEDAARRARAAALKLDPGLLAAQLERVTDEEEDDSARVEALKKLAARMPESIPAQTSLGLAQIGAGLNAEGTRTLDELLKRYPVPEVFYTASLVDVLREQPAAALSRCDEGLKMFPGSQMLLNQRAELLAQGGRHAEAAAVLTELVTKEPTASYYWRLAEQYKQLKDLPKSIAALRTARLWRPQDASVLAELADTLREQGNTPEVGTLYQEAVRLEPGRVRLREKLQLASGEKPVMDLVPPQPAPDLATVDTSRFKTAVFLVDEARIVLYPDFAQLAHYRATVKVLDEAGVKAFSSYPMGPSSATSRATLEVARLHKADGKVQDVRSSAGRWSINFPSLAPGDTIEVSYKVEDFQRGALARNYWGHWSFCGQTGTLGSRFVLIAPQGTELKTATHGKAADFQQRDSGAWTIREWSCGERQAMSQDNLAQKDAGDWLDLSTVPGWKQVASWYLDLSAPRCHPDEQLTAKALELTRGATTEDEKIRRLVAFVARDIEYQTTPFRTSAFIPTQGKQVLEDGYGDCKDKSALLCAMLEAVGLEGQMVLLNTRDQGLRPVLPSPRFNHAITLVKTARGPRWIDPTAADSQLLSLPTADQGVRALVIAPESQDLVTVPLEPLGSSRMDSLSKGRLTGTGALEGSFKLTYTGSLAAMLRGLLSALSPEAHDQVLRATLTSLVGAGTIPGKCQLLGLDKPDAPLVFTLAYRADRHARSAGGYLLVGLPWGEDFGSTLAIFSSLRGKPQDVDLIDSRGVRLLEVDLELPAGYVAEAVPPRKLQNALGSYVLDYRVSGNRLKARAEIKMDCSLVPAKDNPQLLALFDGLQQGLSEPIVLRRAKR